MHVRRIIGVMGRILPLVLALAVAVPLILRAAMAIRFRGDRYTPETVPAHRVAIVFGARVYPNGGLSAMLADRVATAVDLYRAGKAEVLLMTGDNRTPDYDEPSAMKRAAVQMGVPETAIVVDFAGRRTYDSCYRAHDIFRVSDAILVSQNFHLDRALMLCNALGVSAVAVAADYQRPWGYSTISMTYSQLREIPAVFMATIDIAVKPTPVLGEPLPIFPEGDMRQ